MKIYLVADSWNGVKNEKGYQIVAAFSTEDKVNALIEARKKLREEKIKEVAKCKKCTFGSCLAKDVRFLDDDKNEKRLEGLPECFNTDEFAIMKVQGKTIADDEPVECENFKSEKIYVPNEYVVETIELDKDIEV